MEENPKVSFRISTIIVLCVVCFGVSGCFSKSPPLGKVEGTVSFDGKPLEEGTIIFTVSGARDASGLIKNGEIQQVTSFKPGDGAPLGEAKIAVIAVKPSTGSISPANNPSPDTPGTSTMTGPSEFLIPTRYTNPEKSGLTATITKGTNEIHLELTK